MTSARSFSLPTGPFRATVSVPGDKSLSHRAYIFAGMAAGQSAVAGAGTGADVASTRNVVAELGVEIDGEHVRSPGVDDWTEPAGDLDCGNSGTTLRLMAGALSGRPYRSTLTGDRSLRRRPMRRLVAPLGALGADITTTHEGTAPVIVGGGELGSADVEIPIASAQVRSSFALAALQGRASSRVDSPAGFRDHTERWLSTLGLGVWESKTAFRIHPGSIPPHRYEVPGDPSSAAYLWALAATRRGAWVTTPNVSLNPGRIGFLQVLEQLGAVIDAEVTSSMLGDPVGTVTVTGRGLFSTEVRGTLTAASLDELPLVGVVAALGEGITTVADAAELRTKESDRIASTVAMIRALGGGAEETEDGFVVVGTGFLEPGVVETNDDHRIAMAAAVAASRISGVVQIEDAEVAAVSWPTFYEDLEAVCSSR